MNIEDIIKNEYRIINNEVLKSLADKLEQLKRMPPQKFKQLRAKKNHWTKWESTTPWFKFKCCGCQMIHLFQIKPKVFIRAKRI